MSLCRVGTTPSSGAIPLIKPDVRISRIRLSEVIHQLALVATNCFLPVTYIFPIPHTSSYRDRPHTDFCFDDNEQQCERAERAERAAKEQGQVFYSSSKQIRAQRSHAVVPFIKCEAIEHSALFDPTGKQNEHYPQFRLKHPVTAPKTKNRGKSAHFLLSTFVGRFIRAK